MSTTVARINAVVTANTTQFTKAMNGAEAKANGFKGKLGALAKQASGPLTLGLIAAGGAAAAMATDFESSMSKIESLVGVAGDEVDAMKGSVLELSGKTAQAPKKLADAMFFIQSAGLRGATAMDTLEASAKAASVGLGDVEQIADLATSALNAYGEENLSATEATDVMVAAVREGKLEASELAGSMGRVLPIASAMGVRFDEVGAAFAAMSRTGTNAAEAATQVRGILAALLRPTVDAEKALKEMGLTSAGLREQIADKGLLSTLQTLSEQFDGNDAAAARVFGNIRALSGVMDLMGANVATTEQIFANMADTTGTLDAAFAVASETAGFKFQQAMADLQAVMIDIGGKVLPVVLTMLDGMSTIVGGLVGGFDALPTPLKVATAAMVAFVVASGPIGQIALAVGGLLYVVGKMGEESKKAAARQKSLTDEFKKAEDPASTMIDRMREMADAIEDVGDESVDLEGRLDSLVGSSTAMGMALDSEVLGSFNDLGISMDDVARVAKSGTDVFQEMETAIGDGLGVGTLREMVEGLTGAERKLANALIDGLEAKDITKTEFMKMADVIDETADAFDDHREAIDKDAEAFIKSTDAAKLLNNANLDAQQILGDLADSGKTYTEQAEAILYMTDDVTGSMERFTFQANLGVEATANLAESEQETVDVTNDLTESFTQLDDVFSAFMGSLTSEGEALNNTQILLAEMDERLKELSASNIVLPEQVRAVRDEYYTFADEVGTKLDDMVASGLAINGPEMQGATTGFVSQLENLAQYAQINDDEFSALKQTLLSMVGLRIPIQIDATVNVPTSVAGFSPEVSYGDTYYGATGGIVTRPTMALIGEAGPEAVVPLNEAPGAMPLDESGFGGGSTTTINVTSPASPADIEAAVKFAMLSSPY